MKLPEYRPDPRPLYTNPNEPQFVGAKIFFGLIGLIVSVGLIFYPLFSLLGRVFH